MTTNQRHGTRRRTRLAAVPLAVVFALAGVAACGSDDGDTPDGGDGRVTVVLRPTQAAGPDTLEQAREILRKRLEFAGVEDESVRIDGDRIVVSAPDRYRELLDGIGESGRLEFRVVLAGEQVAGGPSGGPSDAPTAPAASGPPVGTGAPGGTSGAPGTTGAPGSTNVGGVDLAPFGVTPEMTAAFAALDCTDPATAQSAAATSAKADPAKPLSACSKEAEDGRIERLLLGPAVVVGTDLTTVKAQEPSNPGVASWEIVLEFGAAGTDKFARVTGDLADGTYPTNRFAAVVDGRVVVAPTVATALLGGNAVITGDFTRSEANRLAASLKAGVLPVPLTVESTSSR